jgi:hypothetical protein
MLESLITSKTRIKLLLKFFLNPNNEDYLRNLENELGGNNNAIRKELNKLESAGLIISEIRGNKKIFRSNKLHPLFSNINSILLKFTGLDEIINLVLNNLGELKQVYLTGELAQGNNSETVDLIVIGNINQKYFKELITKAEKYIKKEVRFIIFDEKEFSSKKNEILKSHDLLIWGASTSG